MIKPVFYIVFTLFIAFHLKSQENLVPNGSFEEYDTCPYAATQINFTNYWFNGNQGTVDYFNSCALANSSVSVPNNGVAYQPAYQGAAYTGFVIISDTNTNYREYLKVRLKKPLQIGQMYDISLYISIAGKSAWCGISKVGFLFTHDSTISNLPIIYNANAVYAYQNITDTANWVKISRSYLANDNYEYLIIGDFSLSDSLSLIPMNSVTPCNASYVFVDNFIVTDSELSIPNVFTPNNDGTNDVFKIQDVPPSTKISIYNRWGNVVFQSNDASIDFWNGKCENKEASQGTYYYVIQNNYIKKTGFLQLIR